jgi:predicted glycogen debranching enzyme
MTTLRFGRQVCGTLDEGAAREWLVTDGLGGYAMGTVSGLATRRYHGLLVVATQPPIGRHMGLAALDPVLVLGDARIRLSTHEWASGALAPTGHEHLESFALVDGVPRWRWSGGTVVLEAELAMAHGRPAVGVRYRLVRAGGSAGPDGTIGLEVEALATWRDVHGERFAGGDPAVDVTADGFTFEGAYRVRGPGFRPGGEWYHGVHHREEAARGLQPEEDLWFAGRFSATLAAGEACEVSAWAGDLADAPPPAGALIDAGRARARAVAHTAGAADDVEARLAHAADQFVVATASGPTVVAGYPWFGDWSRDTMTSYEGLFLETGRADEGRALLEAATAAVSEGMLANTADAGGTEFNTVDGAMWFLHAVGRHVERTGDTDLGKAVLPALHAIVEHHVAGTRFGIRVDGDGLVTQGADGWALTWMDARVDGDPITPRRGKPVEVDALWVDGLAAAAAIARAVGEDPEPFSRLGSAATRSFAARFVRPDGRGLFDVVDGPDGDDPSVRPNQLLAVSLPNGPLRGDGQAPASVLAATAPLVTSLGLRSLSPLDSRYTGRHRGEPAARDAAYHQGTVWPWLVGPYVEALLAAGARPGPDLLQGLEAHLDEWGLGSVSETADGDVPHAATGCPFQAWSVAELLRARRRLGAG